MPMPSVALQNASITKLSENLSSNTKSAAGALMAVMSRYSCKFLRFCKKRRHMISSSWPMKANCLVTISRIGHGNRVPVVGTAGLYATSWHPAVELWGGTQFQNRFKRLNNRNMRPLDYNVWMAVRSVGEAATRKRSADVRGLIAYLLTPDFELAAFKGRKLTYRNWDGQLRQPILVTTDKLHVTVSPQPQFLHQFSELDTLGYDRPESTCKAFNK